MKKELIYLSIFVLLISIVSGEEYYISSSIGNDNNDGLSESTPWRTISKLNNQPLIPGDKILFKSSDSWRLPLDSYINFKSGNESDYITYTSYGKGDKPLFLGSVVTIKSEWRLLDRFNKYWVYTNIYPYEVGNIILNTNQVAIKKSTINDVRYGNSGDYYYKHQYPPIVYIKSPTNPTQYYNTIEIVLSKSIFYLGSNNYTIIDGIALKNGAYLGIEMNGGHDIIIRNTDISYIGGGLSNTPPVRWGNAIQSWNAGYNILVENNNIWEIWDAALTTQGGIGNKSNVVFRNNQVWNSVYCFEYFNWPATITDGIIFDHNTCVNTGQNVWKEFGNQRKGYDSGPDCFRFGHNKNVNNTRGVVVTNNICYNTTKHLVTLDQQGGGVANNGEYLDVDYNLYYQEPNTIFHWKWINQSFQDYKEYSSQDANSRIGDPLFVDVENNDFRLYNNSIACNMGSDGGYVGALSCDYQQSNIPYNFMNFIGYETNPNFTDRELRMFRLGQLSRDLLFPLLANVTQLPYREFNSIWDIPLENDCYDKTHCYVRWQ